MAERLVHIDGLDRQFRLCRTVGDGAAEGLGSIQFAAMEREQAGLPRDPLCG